jgi:D-amino-acid dehydrogenase
MKIAILGGGVIGVTSAYYLARAGHDVTLVDRQPGPALETSFANAGEISPGYASPWAGPGMISKAIKWMLMNHPPLILRPAIDPAMLRWLVAMLGNCNASAYAINKARMVRLAEFSRDELMRLRAETGINYDERALGTLQLFRTQKQIDGSAKDIAVLQESGVPCEILDRAGCIAVEPGLAATADKFLGGLRLPNDETGDCFKFTNALRDLATTAGVTFRFDTTIERIEIEAGKVAAVRTGRGAIMADRYLLALGSYAAAMLSPLGIRLPVYPVKGYSITAQILDPDRAPVSTLMDETYKIAITRLGDRIRVGGMAQISGFDLSLPEKRRETLAFSVADLFPGAADLVGASFWSGLRPMTPDGTPIIGRSRISNLFLNCGHGTLGWTMACGSAHVIADLLSDRATAIETDDLSLERYT